MLHEGPCCYLETCNSILMNNGVLTSSELVRYVQGMTMFMPLLYVLPEVVEAIYNI